MFFKKNVLRSFTKFTGKHLCQSLFLISFKPQAATLLEHQFLRTSFWQNTSGGCFCKVINLRKIKCSRNPTHIFSADKTRSGSFLSDAILCWWQSILSFLKRSPWERWKENGLHQEKFPCEIGDGCKTGSSEAVARRCSVKKVFLEISENLQESNCVSLFF